MCCSMLEMYSSQKFVVGTALSEEHIAPTSYVSFHLRLSGIPANTVEGAYRRTNELTRVSRIDNRSSVKFQVYCICCNKICVHTDG